MSELKFYKYHGAGNDFVMLDGFTDEISLSAEQVEKICHRHFGIGADGLIILKPHETADFEMLYHNSDGAIGSMCGNGARCSVTFAKRLGLIPSDCTFLAYDGLHTGKILEDGNCKISMQDIGEIQQLNDAVFIDTGSPHHLIFLDETVDLEKLDVEKEGRAIRNSQRYIDKGTNVNFIKVLENNKLAIRTYERGVEAETLACGTGITAAALGYDHQYKKDGGKITVEAVGGTCKVSFSKSKNGYIKINLAGPAEFVFEGNIKL